MNLYKSLRKGRIGLATRIVFPPMATQASDGGLPGARLRAHYTRIAENPLVGLIITEHAFTDPRGRADPYQVSLATDEAIAAHRALTDAVHAVNPRARIFAQISHAGANTDEDITSAPLVSASAAPWRGRYVHPLTVPEIKRIAGDFARAASRVKQAGYDGVEIHAAHAYLLNQFYSPLTNLRADEYGSQSIENHTRFIVDVLRAVRETVGDFPVAVRLGGADYMDGGSTIGDAAAAAQILERESVDLIDLSGGLCIFHRPGHTEPGFFADLSTAVKSAVDTPVVLTGGVQRPEDAASLLGRGAADLIGVGRAMFRNPNWGSELRSRAIS